MCFFLEQKISVEILKIMKRHHIEKLFKNLPIGTQILFEHRLENWRKALNITLENEFDISNYIKYPIQNLCSPSSSASTASFHPYLPSRPETPDVGTKINLADILNTAKGQMLCSFYEINNKFEEEQRNSLINLICQYFDEKQVPMTLGTSHRIENDIMVRFKNEKLVIFT